MAQASADKRCPFCEYTPRFGDKFPIPEYEVIHVICHSCGKEYVE